MTESFTLNYGLQKNTYIRRYLRERSMNKANDDKNMVVESWDSSEYLSWGKGM
jgi:hypothetical protein